MAMILTMADPHNNPDHDYDPNDDATIHVTDHVCDPDHDRP